MKNAAIVVLVILTILANIYGFMQGIEANRQVELAKAGESRALLAEDAALRARDRAEKDHQEAKRLAEELAECRKNKGSK